MSLPFGGADTQFLNMAMDGSVPFAEKPWRRAVLRGEVAATSLGVSGSRLPRNERPAASRAAQWLTDI